MHALTHCGSQKSPRKREVTMMNLAESLSTGRRARYTFSLTALIVLSVLMMIKKDDDPPDVVLQRPLVPPRSTIPNRAVCEPMLPSNATVTKPIWIPGYPGSGSEMVRDMIRAITGMEAGEVGRKNQQNCFAGTAITCKTHWPFHFHESPVPHVNESFASAVMLLRNPSKAIPSYFNFYWEKRLAGIKSHSKQAPEASWKSWRDRQFDRNIELWRETILQWHTNVPYQIAFHLPYEQLVNESTAPTLLRRLALLFRNAGGTVAPDSHLACSWRNVVVEHPRKKRKEHEYTPGFRAAQKKIMLRVLNELMETLADQKELVQILREYKKDVRNHLQVDND